jgi:N utilization substance protein B
MSGNPRHRAREAALQILYSCDVGGLGADEAIDTYFVSHAPESDQVVRELAARLVLGTTSDQARIDALIQQHSEHWRFERLATIDRLILRMAVFELDRERQTPAAVVINEAIELARTFSTDDSARFVNGVLDAVRRALERRPGGPASTPGA